ncbi:beta-ketoacyl synthase N-terminal-like domain-containing protein [Scytonema sp. PRP1]|uniref:beta-ketoacyl synthase N-terminal-like domain-containing protein n=1 Tax=Scytonema sp. PRP1 TaxID=3120513 RepID=UPI002FD40B4E
MSKNPANTDYQSLMKQALIDLKEMRTKLDYFERTKTEPIAIIGIGCRFPGGSDNPEAFWQLLHNGVNAIIEVPKSRWNIDSYYDENPDVPGKISTRYGGFLDRVCTFDPQFFGISPREAVSLDPQQRLILEVSWEALENANQVPEQLFKSKTGVFVGICSSDYSQQNLLTRTPAEIDAYLATGNSHSMASGRLSYLLGFTGPSISVDTACSSSLVTVHLACQSLRNRECDLALAGGVNVLLSPELSITFSKARMLAPDGRCKTFDAEANGYVRAEGCGMIVLKRLSDAVADKDNILALIRGSGVNQDGPSGGLTVPSGPSQEEVIRQSLASGNVEANEVSYIEAHGTGTSLGDPIEIGALAEVYCKKRPQDQPLMVGSVKTNIGHLEGAAGIAGLIKVVLTLQHEEIPPHLHFKQPNPHIPWNQLPIVVTTQRIPWSRGEKRRLAGVSSFGFSGTNAHIVLEEAPVSEAISVDMERPLHLLTLSAKTEEALKQLSEQYNSYLANNPTLSIGDICFTANTGRSHFNHRLSIVTSSSVELREQLAAFTTGQEATRVFTGCVQGTSQPKITFLFTGQGSQYIGMGRQLYETQPTFRASIDLADKILRSYLKKPLLEVLYPEPGMSSPLNETAYTQPALFALEYALFQLWKSWGIEPSFVMGHSVGEYVAACVAGVFSLEDGLKLIAERARLMQLLPPDGEMVAVLADEVRVTAAIQRYGQEVSIAAYNGPESLVISGRRQAICSVVTALAAEGVKTTTLKVSHAFHSPLMEPILADFQRVAQEISYSLPNIEVVSNVTGKVVAAEIATPQYWCRHIRQPVKYATGMETLQQMGCKVFVEIGPKPILLGMGRQCLPEGVGVWLPSLRQGEEDWQQILQSLANLYILGVRVDWSGFDQDYSHHRLQLPTYPWQKERYWLEGTQEEQRDENLEALHLWESAVSAGRYQAQRGPLDLALHTYPAKQQCLEELTIAYITNALSNFGAYNQPGEIHSLDNLLHQFKISSAYRKLLSRWLNRLVSVGFLKQQEEEIFVCDRPLPTPQINSLVNNAKEFFTDAPFLLDYLQRCGNQLTNILTGKLSPLETLFPEASLETAENIYEKWAVARYFNDIARRITEAVVKALPPGKHLRILEIGAGTGGTTTSLLPVLPPERTTYYFTDISDFFFIRAQQKFKEYSFVHYSLLDIEQNPQDAGYNHQSFDLIVATNVLHATCNLGKTLKHVQSLLAPGGLLLLNEVTEHASWLEISVALIEGWQLFDDPLRQDNPLLSHEQWQEALRDSGFEKVATFPELGSSAEVLGQHIIIAQVPVCEAHPEACTTSAVAKPNIVSNTIEEFFTSPIVEQKLEPILTFKQFLAAEPQERYEMLESYLSEQAARALGLSTSKISLEQPLKEMGFDSLMVVDIKNRIETGLGIVMPTVNFFQSIKHLTTEVFEELQALSSTSCTSKDSGLEIAVEHPSSVSKLLVAIQPRGSKIPFVCVHPGGLDISCYANLIPYFDKEQPFYALQPSELDNYRSYENQLLSFPSIKDVAARCIEALQTLQPQGPYLLGGWSFGGCVAFEMAQQLQKQGHKVLLLALLDVIIQGINEVDDSALVYWFASYLGARRNKELPLHCEELKKLDFKEQLNYVLKQAIIAEVLSPNTDLSQIDYLFQVYKAGVQTSLQQVQNYEMQSYPNQITLFHASQWLDGFVHKSKLDWEDSDKFSSQPPDVHIVPGNHYTMLIEPYVQILADKLKNCLNRVQ